MEGWSIPLGLVAFGVLAILVALAGLNEYRKLFIAHPREAMSLDVLLQLIAHPASAPALLSALLLCFGAFFLATGVLVLIVMLGVEIPELLNRLWPKS